VRATEAQIDQIRVRCALMNCIRSAAPNGGYLCWSAWICVAFGDEPAVLLRDWS